MKHRLVRIMQATVPRGRFGWFADAAIIDVVAENTVQLRQGSSEIGKNSCLSWVYEIVADPLIFR